MGIIIKQSIKGSFWSYVGVVIGFITTSYLYPKFLTTEVVGLLGVLIAYSQLFSSISLLGLHGVIGRLFPYFRNPENGHNGFLFIAFLFYIVGTALFLLFFSWYSPYLVESNLEKSPLLARYAYLLIPLTISTMLFTVFDSFNRMLYDTVSGTFLQDFLQRLFILLSLVLFAVKYISLNQFIIAYIVVVSLKAILLLWLLGKRKELNFRPDLSYLNKGLKKEIGSVALFSLISGVGTLIVFSLDKIIINSLLDLSNAGVYTIAFYFGSLIVIPSRSLLSISNSLIADAWKVNNLSEITSIYNKSCLNQLIIASFLFLGLWVNIDNVLEILGPSYSEAKWVIFFIGLGYLVDMLTGSNAQIINLSRYYKVNVLFICLLIGVMVASMYLLIPVWGIVGAAVSIAVALFLNNLMRFIFLLWKYKLQPFNMKFLYIIAFNLGLYFVVSIIPQQSLILDISIRGSLISIATFAFLFYFPISEDISSIFHSAKERVKRA